MLRRPIQQVDGQIYSDPRNWAAGRLCDEARGESLSNDAWGGLGHAARDPLACPRCASATKPHPSAPFCAARRYEIRFGSSSCSSRMPTSNRTASKFAQVRLGACAGCCVCHEGAIATPHMALRAFPWTTGHDFLFCGGLLIELQPRVCPSFLLVAAVRNAGRRHVC